MKINEATFLGNCSFYPQSTFVFTKYMTASLFNSLTNTIAAMN